MAASVANWLPSNLDNALQNRYKGVKGNLDKLAISGHSREGKSAFALALSFSHTKLTVKLSALIGVDTVAGYSTTLRSLPKILTYQPKSFNLSITTTVIGTDLANCTIVCAPNGVNHQEFYVECKNASHFVIMKYGHLQMLDGFMRDPIAREMSYICRWSWRYQTTMRTTLGGIMVAFLDAFLKNGQYYVAIVNDGSLAPFTLLVEKKDKWGPNYALAW